jgi:hypothetical protein
MDDQIEGVVKRRNRDDGSDWLSAGKGHSTGASRRQIHRQFAAVKMSYSFDRQTDAIFRPFHFDTGIDQRFADLIRDKEGSSSKRSCISAAARLRMAIR